MLHVVLRGPSLFQRLFERGNRLHRVGVELVQGLQRRDLRHGTHGRHRAEGGNRLCELQLVGGDGGEYVLFRHVQHGVALYGDELAVVLDEDFLAASDFLRGEHAVLFKERDILGGVEQGEAIHRGGQVEQPAPLRLLDPFRGVVVAVEYDSAVLAHNAFDYLVDGAVEVLCLAQLLRGKTELVRHDGVEDGVGVRNRERGAQHTELELVAREGERGSAVAVGAVHCELGEHADADFDLAGGATRIGPVLGNRLQNPRELVAEVEADDCGRRFVRTQTVVVARACRAYAQQILVLVHGGDHERDDEQELRAVRRALAGVEDVVPEVGDERPVVVLAAAVDAGKGLFVQQAGHAVLRRDFAHDFHRQLVLVGGDIDGAVDGRKFVLCGRDFVVLGLGKHAELPQLLVQVAHERRDAGLDCAEVVVLELLSLGRLRAEQSPARIDEVAPLFKRLGVDEEIFLLGTDRGEHLFRLSAEEAEQGDRFAADGFHGTEQRSLFVECLAVVAAECGRNAECAVLDEGVGGGVPCGVAAGFESRAETAARERAGVGLAFDELLAAELHYHAAVVGGGDEGIVFFGGETRHGLEPVSEMRDSLFDRPVLHRICDDICRFKGQRTVVFATVFELTIGVFGQPFAHDLVVEDHAPEKFGHNHNGALLLPRDAEFNVIILDNSPIIKLFAGISARDRRQRGKEKDAFLRKASLLYTHYSGSARYCQGNN